MRTPTTRRRSTIGAIILAADVLPLATFDRDQRRYGVATRDP